jgi:hypothetical protein
MVVEETCVYQPSNDGYNHTRYRQEALITAFMPIFKTKFEAFTHSNLHAKSGEGVATIEALCQRIQTNGVSALVDPLIDAAKAAGASIQHAYAANLAKSAEAFAAAGVGSATAPSAPSAN